MTYKGYEGIAKFDEEAGLFTGEVINTRDVITFQGKSVAELKRAFAGRRTGQAVLGDVYRAYASGDAPSRRPGGPAHGKESECVCGGPVEALKGDAGVTRRLAGENACPTAG
jgi:hypothetical protein